MNLQEVMKERKFVVVGDTLNKEKYAYKIKTELLENGYEVYCVGKELKSINDISEEIDIIDLCINPIKGLAFMQECTKPFKGVVIQPGAESLELLAYLHANKIRHVEGCLLVGLKLYVAK